MVCSSMTCTSRPAGSPFGEASQLPSAAEVASTQNGAEDSQATSRSVRVGRSLSRTRGTGSPSRSVSAATSVISVHVMRRRYAGRVGMQTEIQAPRLALRIARHRRDLVEHGLQPVLHPTAVLGGEPETQPGTVQLPGPESLDLLEERLEQQVAAALGPVEAGGHVERLARGQVGPFA